MHFYYDKYFFYPLRYLPTRILLFCFLMTNSFLSFGQNFELGTPPIRNFTKKIYAASPQNWQIGQRSDGMMLFANNLGLLTFTGNSWDLYPIANRTIVRSLLVHPDQRIYIGGQGEFGFFDQKENGRLKYKDLTPLIPQSTRNFADVWQLGYQDKYVLFQTTKEVLIYDGKSVRVYQPPATIKKMFSYRRANYINLSDGSLLKFNGNSFEPVFIAENLPADIVNICDISNGNLRIAGYRSGIFDCVGTKCSLNAFTLNPLYKNLRITVMQRLRDGHIMIGTMDHGLIIVSESGNVLLSLKKENGLINTSILAAMEDRNGNIWVSTESGIDFIEYKSPFRFLFPDIPYNGTGYSMALFRDRLYLGTNNGLYYTEMLQDRSGPAIFREVAGSKDICWDLDVIDDNLWLGHNEGASIVADDHLLPAFRGKGVWRFIKQDSQNIIFGSYEGFGMITQEGQQYVASILPGFDESSRIVLIDSSFNIWMSHPYRGVYKLKKPHMGSPLSFRKYGLSGGLESDHENYIIKTNNRIYASNDKGIFIYDPKRDQFRRDPTLESLIGYNTGTKLISADEYQNIWFRKGLKIGFLEPYKDEWKVEYRQHILPALPESLAGGFEKVYPLTKDIFLFNCESGFLLFDKRKLIPDLQYTTYLYKCTILSNRDSILLKGVEPNFIPYSKNKPLTLNHDQNSLRFDFSCFSFSDLQVEYKYTLTGSSKSVSAWTSEPFVIYNNLDHGNYQISVQTRIGNVLQKGSIAFHFTIQPAWYNTLWFRGSVLLCMIAFIFGLFLLQDKRFKTEKKQLTQKHKRLVSEHADKVAQSEEEIIRLKNEQLQKDIQFKNNELASLAMHLAHKKDFIQHLESDLKTIQKEKTKNVDISANLARIIHRLQHESTLDEDWERFSHYFNEVNQGFILRLKEKYPNLTPNDHRLAAYLRMNLSTKDIAALSNISIRGVEGSRYRLRKKMNLENDDNLHEIMNSI